MKNFKTRFSKVSLVVGSVVVFFITGLLMFVSCSKDTHHGSPTNNFFKNGDEAFQTVQRLLTSYRPGEKLLSIESISYMSNKEKEYAFVFYRSETGVSNLAIEQDVEGEDEFGATSYKCEGTSCDCLVVTQVGSGGKLKISCNCTSCNMITHPL